MMRDSSVFLDVLLAVSIAVFVFAAAQLLSLTLRGGGF